MPVHFHETLADGLDESDAAFRLAQRAEDAERDRRLAVVLLRGGDEEPLGDPVHRPIPQPATRSG